MRLLKILSFGTLGLLVLALMAATLLEKGYGSRFAAEWVYGSPLFVAGWGVMVVSAIAYLVCCKVQKRFATFLLHLSFAAILLGALVTHVWGVQGSLYLRQEVDRPVRTFVASDGEVKPFPFGVRLEDFRVEYYPGTSAPMDFVSRLLVDDGSATAGGEVSMNRIYSYRHYRFYQSGYDADGRGVTLAVAFDPWGIALTYAGYGLLLCSMVLFFFERGSGFRKLLRHPLLRSAAVCAGMLLLLSAEVQAGEAARALPRTLPRETAAEFGNLYVYYNDRISPLQTLARDFTVKLCGKPSYRGLSAEQVLTGWFFYYDSWKEEPCIRIKNGEVQRLLGIEGGYARLSDFAGEDGYKLDEGLLGAADVSARRAIEEANEKFSLISMVATGSLWRIYPVVSLADSTETGRLHWYSLADRLPSDMPAELGRFVRGSMNYIGEQVARGDFGEVVRLLGKIRKYQEKEGGGLLPSAFRFRAERCYNSQNNSLPLAAACITLGILAFIGYCRCMAARKPVPPKVTKGLLALLVVLFLYLCFLMALRGIVGGHIPMSNGYETMQLMAACTALLTLFLCRKMPMAVSFGFLLCGLSLMVSMLGESNPQVTQLMPVLHSPLLSLHVLVIMVAYSLLAFVMLNGVTAVVLHGFRTDCEREVERLRIVSCLLLYPAVFLLVAGIFIGAVWANLSWGRYWGWDPKETWALITLLVYALALHPASLPCFRKPMFFHRFSIAAFFCVLITYFGVNFLLGGMHSYA